MASDILNLDDERRAGGAALLRMLDGVEFGAVGAAWIYSKDADHWHYLVVTPMVDSEGPQWIYERLLYVFSKFEFPRELTQLDVVIASPYEQEILKIRMDISVINDTRDVRDGIVEIDRRSYLIFAYRFPTFEAQILNMSHRFDSRVRQLSSAA